MEKFALKSVTILGVIVAFLVNVGPMMGLTFSAEDGQMVTEGYDAILTSIATLVAVWGRVRATSQIRLVPFVANTSGSVKHPWLIGLGLLAIAACGQIEGQTPAQQFYGAANQYALTKQEAAAVVSSGPLCSEQDVVTCVPDKLVIAVDDVTDEFDPLIEAAILLFESGTATPTTQQATIALARQALIALAGALAEGEVQ